MYPGDVSGIPYPRTKEAMEHQLKEVEALLRDTEKEYRELEVYTNTVVCNAPLSQEASQALGKYNNALVTRHSAECRIKNLKKMIDNYEAISNDINSRQSHPCGVGEG